MFVKNTITATKIDERNLLQCQYLSLHTASSVTQLNTKYLSNLRVLLINGTKIQFINTASLTMLR